MRKYCLLLEIPHFVRSNGRGWSWGAWGRGDVYVPILIYFVLHHHHPLKMESLLLHTTHL